MKNNKSYASVIFTVEPPEFFANPLTLDNYFQDRQTDFSKSLSYQAVEEHKSFCLSLLSQSIFCKTIKGPEGRPDCIFPNNSFSIHEKGGEVYVILYPMSVGRQNELTPQFIEFLKEVAGDKFYDLRYFQDHKMYLEGTGAINFNTQQDVVFMGRSERAHEKVLNVVCEILGIDPENKYIFDILDAKGRAIYHTNVVSWVGQDIFSMCWESIPEGKEKERLLEYVKKQYEYNLSLSFQEIDNFSGNALEVLSLKGERVLTISRTGYDRMSADNRDILDAYYQGKIIIAAVDIIQKLGGGSVRCMEAQALLTENQRVRIENTIRKYHNIFV